MPLRAMFTTAEYQRCPRCKGTGLEDKYSDDDCRECNGYGEIELAQPVSAAYLGQDSLKVSS